MAKVEYNSENCMKCMCPSCPVQAMSKCTMEKRPKWQDMQKEMNEMMYGPQKMGPRGGMSMPAQEQEMPTMEKEQMGMEKEGGMEMEMLAPEQMIGLYCSSQIGKSKCSADLDTDQMCSCPSCGVWMQNDLESQYYCSEGDADQRG